MVDGYEEVEAIRDDLVRQRKLEHVAEKMALLLDSFSCLADLGFLSGYESLGREARVLVKEWEDLE